MQAERGSGPAMIQAPAAVLHRPVQHVTVYIDTLDTVGLPVAQTALLLATTGHRRDAKIRAGARQIRAGRCWRPHRTWPSAQAHRRGGKRTHLRSDFSETGRTTGRARCTFSRDGRSPFDGYRGLSSLRRIRFCSEFGAAWKKLLPGSRSNFSR